MQQKENSQLVQSGRDVNQEEIALIQETVAMFKGLSRQELAQTLCEHLNWRRASGTNRVDSCMKLMEKLEQQGVLKLPEKQSASPKEQKKITFTERTEPKSEITGSLSDVGQVTLKLVSDQSDKTLWNEFVKRYHYLGYYKPFGYHMRYFIETEQGKLGCMLFSAGSKSIAMRDRWIGWTPNERLIRLSWVTNNSRFVIFPWVKVKNLASWALGQVARRIRQDWQEAWGYRPVLLETFVDPQYYLGTCYKAANWRYLGMTTGEGLARKGKSYTTSPKMIFVQPLVKDFRSELCSLTQTEQFSDDDDLSMVNSV